MGMNGKEPDNDTAEDKRELRTRLLQARGRASEPPADTTARSHALLHLPEVRDARCVALYATLPGEPATETLAHHLAIASVLLLYPTVGPDRDLTFSPAEPGTDAPVDAATDLREADVVIVPALAVDRHGWRLGRGGGSYDRALVRVREGALVVALLRPGELIDAVPHSSHDQPVNAVALPAGVVRLPMLPLAAFP